MPVPSLITDLSATAASNSPSGSEAPVEGDNHLRAAYAFIRQLYDGVSGVAYPTLAQLASTASAADGAGRVWWDYDNAYTAFNGSGAAPIGTKLNLIERDVEEFGALTSGTASANTTAIQAAFTWLKENGGCLKFKPNGTYAVNAALTLLIDSSARKLMSRVVDFRGCTLDWSSSGLTSGVLLTVGATSVSYLTEIHKQELRGPLRIIGPQGESGSTKADFSWMNAPSTTVVGLRTQYAQNWLFSGLTVELCFIGRQRFWTWDDTWLNCTFRKHFYGEESQEACTTGTHIQCAFTYCALPILYRIADTAGQSSSAQTYLDCRTEQSHALAAFDPGNTSGGGAATDAQINGIDFRNLYVEALSTATDLIRVGTKVVDADIITALSGGTQAFSPGADQDKYITNISLTLAKFNHTLSASSMLFAMPGSGNKCFGFDVVAPANPIDNVRNPNKMQSKRWLMAHSKTNVAGQKHIEYSSNRARAIIDGSGTPPTFLQQEGNFSVLRNWPVALGGTIPAGGAPTLGTGEYEISLREDVYSSVLSHNVIGTCSGGGVDGIVVADYANSGRSYVRIRCVNQAGAAFNPSRVTVQWEGALGEI